MRYHRASALRSRAALLVILLPLVLAVDAIGLPRPASASTSPTWRSLGRRPPDFRTRTMWIGPSAFRTERFLRYVVLHELAHGWQSTSTHMQTVWPDMRRWGRSGISAIEANADCIAAIWGAGRGYYWNCPPDARALAARRLANDWG